MNRRNFLKTFTEGAILLTGSAFMLNLIGCGEDEENPIVPVDDEINQVDDDTDKILYKVDESKCTGCEKCAKNCPEDAITIIDDVANIDQDICVQCGECFSVCTEGAIEKLEPSQ